MGQPVPIPEWTKKSDGTMADAYKRLPNEYIVRAADRAGFKGNDLMLAVAIALAESRGNPFAISPGGDYGLWQIRYVAHPGLFDNNAQWYSAQTNANMAYQVYKNAGNRWTPWSVYNHGTYMAYVSEASAAVNEYQKNPGAVGADPLPAQYYAGQAMGGDIGQDIGSAISSIDDVIRLMAAVVSWVSNGNNWIRVGEVVGGALLILVAGYLLARQGGYV